MEYTLSNIAEQISGVSFKPKDVVDKPDKNSIGILRANNIADGKINFDDLIYIKRSKVNQKQILRKGDILICASSGSKNLVGKAAQIEFDCEYSFGAFCKVVRPININSSFLGMYFQSKLYRNYISNASQGININNIKNDDIANIKIKKYSQIEQEKISQILSKLDFIISLRKQQLTALDTLIKARFVEMFGDPVSNPYNFKKENLDELADIKIGPFGSLLHKEDYINNGYPLINPSHIIDGKLVPDNNLSISAEKYNALNAYHLYKGDVVMGRRGEMGRCAVVKDDGLLCGTGSMIIRPKDKIEADFIQRIISYTTFKNTIEDMSVGQTMQNLNVPIVSKFQIIVPPIETQNLFYTFTETIDKSKVVVQKALDEAQILFDNLMQQYFG